MKLDLKDFERFKKVIYEKTGIDISIDKKFLLETKLNKLLYFGKYKDLEDFYQKLKSGTEESFHDLIRYITTNYSFFFREKEHFDILVKSIKDNNKSNPVIWCAAASTGEEVYSIIIYLFENNILDFTLIASDIDRTVLHKLNKGEYSKEKLTEVPKYLLHRYFTRESRYSTTFKIKRELREKIIIKRLNLIDAIVFEKKIDYIFCRNVLIYFDKTSREKVLRTLMRNMNKDSLLFLSMSENIISMNLPLVSVSSSVYVKRE